MTDLGRRLANYDAKTQALELNKELKTHGNNAEYFDGLLTAILSVDKECMYNLLVAARHHAPAIITTYIITYLKKKHIFPLNVWKKIHPTCIAEY